MAGQPWNLRAKEQHNKNASFSEFYCMPHISRLGLELINTNKHSLQNALAKGPGTWAQQTRRHAGTNRYTTANSIETKQTVRLCSHQHRLRKEARPLPPLPVGGSPEPQVEQERGLPSPPSGNQTHKPCNNSEDHTERLQVLPTAKEAPLPHLPK